MKTKLLTIFVIMLAFTTSNMITAQTSGTLTCSFNTTFTNGSWGTKYVLAAWIQTNSGTFVKTKLKYSKTSNHDHIQTWVNASGLNVVDATTGATLAAPGAISFTWNGTDVNAAIVTDGIYKVWLEMAWGSSMTTGKTVQSFSFTKGTNSDYQTGATTNFTGVTLDWVPTSTGIEDKQEKLSFSISPNPISRESIINYSLKSLTDVSISLYDINGKLVEVLFDKNQTAGDYRMPLSIKKNIKPGVYFIKMYTGNSQHTERILVSE